MEQLSQTLMQAFIAIASACIALLAAMAVSYINKLKDKATSEINKINNESQANYANQILNIVYTTMSNCIDKIETTSVKTLKQTTKDGKLTKEDQKIVQKEALDLFKSIISQDVYTALGQVVGDTEKYLVTLIDSMVLEKKEDLLKNGVDPSITSGSSSMHQLNS